MHVTHSSGGNRQLYVNISNGAGIIYIIALEVNLEKFRSNYGK